MIEGWEGPRETQEAMQRPLARLAVGGGPEGARAPRGVAWEAGRLQDDGAQLGRQEEQLVWGNPPWAWPWELSSEGMAPLYLAFLLSGCPDRGRGGSHPVESPSPRNSQSCLLAFSRALKVPGGMQWLQDILP